MAGAFVYATKVEETDGSVRYDVRRDSPEAEVDGVLVISKADADDAWSVEGAGASRALASLVVGRIVRLSRARGEWPERVAKQ